jgi:hypothetical protein
LIALVRSALAAKGLRMFARPAEIDRAPLALWRRLQRPAWSRAYIVSAVLHALAVLVVGWLASLVAGKAGPTVENITIALRTQAEPIDYFADEDAGEVGLAQAADVMPVAGENSPAPSLASALPEGPPPVSTAGVLPSGTDAEAVPTAEALANTSASGFASGEGHDAAGGLRGALADGRARTSVFNVAGEGYKFVYVFDRSGSMGGSGHSPLAAAKAELLASLTDLDETHQFQIIFYNEKPAIFSLAGSAGQLVWGTQPNKQRAGQFVESIVADGGSGHEEALLAGLKLGPDVIFFLTDAGAPGMSAAQLDRVRRRNNGTVIHAIEFGLGPQVDEDNFLVRLARENRGEHVYFDVSQLGRRRRPDDAAASVRPATPGGGRR